MDYLFQDGGKPKAKKSKTGTKSKSKTKTGTKSKTATKSKTSTKTGTKTTKSKTGTKKTGSKKGGNFLGSIGELVAPTGWGSFATAAALVGIDRADAAFRRKKSEKSSAKKGGMFGNEIVNGPGRAAIDRVFGYSTKNRSLKKSPENIEFDRVKRENEYRKSIMKIEENAAKALESAERKHAINRAQLEQSQLNREKNYVAEYKSKLRYFKNKGQLNSQDIGNIAILDRGLKHDLPMYKGIKNKSVNDIIINSKKEIGL